MNESEDQAKAMFLSFLGNRFEMHRAGQLELYKSWCIPKETESEWLEELISSLISELSIRDWEAVTKLEIIARTYPEGKRIVHQVAAFVTRHLMSADSIVKLFYAERMVALIKTYQTSLDQNELYASYKASEQLLLHIQSAPLVVDSGHELSRFNLKDKRTLNMRAQRCLDLLYQVIG